MAVKLGRDDDAPIMLDGENLELTYTIGSLCEEDVLQDLTLPLTVFLRFQAYGDGFGLELVLGGQAKDGESYLETDAVKMARPIVLPRTTIHKVLGRDGGINARLLLPAVFGDEMEMRPIRKVLLERFKKKLVETYQLKAVCRWAGEGDITVTITVSQFGERKFSMSFDIPRTSALTVLEDRRRK